MTMERAKAAHLSRQLQLRLQYARLKVEHGWQKQNLNEVENLYFRHSHTKPRQSPADQILMSLSIPSAIQQSPRLSSASEVQTNSRPNGTAVESSEIVEENEVLLQPSPPRTSPAPHVLASNSPTPTIPEDPPVPSLEPSPMAVDSTAAISTVVQLRSNLPEFPPVSQLTAAHKPGAPEITPTYPIASYYGALFPAQPAPTFGTRYAQIPVPAPLPAPHRKAPVASLQPSTTPQTQPPPSSSPAVSSSIPVADPFKFGTAATGSLTYDSFWSSHLASRTRTSFSSALSSDSIANKPAIANPLPRRASDLAQTLSGYLSSQTTSGGVVQAGNQQPEVSSRV